MIVGDISARLFCLIEFKVGRVITVRNIMFVVWQPWFFGRGRKLQTDCCL
jgi:hypothetical protein